VSIVSPPSFDFTPRSTVAPSRFPAQRGRPESAGLIVAAVAAAVLMGLQLASPDGLVGDVSYLAVLIGAAIAALWGARRSPLGVKAWFLAIGISISATADVIWQWLEWSRGEAPDVSVADVFWLGSYFAVAAALLHTGRRGERVDRDGLVDIAVVFLVALVTQWELGFDEVATDTSVPVSVRLVWTLYPTMDAALLALVVRAAVTRRLHGWLAVFVGGGTACWLVSDFGYTMFANGSAFDLWLNLGWMLGSVLFAAATLCRRGVPTSATPSADAEPTATGHGGIAIALVPLAVPGAIVIVDRLRDDSTNPYLLYAVMVSLIGLAFTRGARILRAEAEARAAVRSQERYARAVAANSADAHVVVNQSGAIINDAPQLAALLGHAGATTIGADVFLLVAPDDQLDVRRLFERCAQNGGTTFETECRVQHGSGHQMWINVRLVNLIDDPDVGGIVVNLEDISDRKQVEAELLHQAFHDGLTNLANRALFVDRVEHALRRNARTGLDAAVVFMDLDGFKTVNDSLGHGAGDQLLQEIATRLGQAVRTSDTVARLGGDEFAILIEESRNPVEESKGVAERMLQSLESPIQLDGQAVTIAASFGIAAGAADATATSLLRDADIAMYRAKSEGRGRWVVYDPDMRAAAVERLQLENDLIGALDAHQFVLVYQPIIELETEEIVGFEALIRWDHPTLGRIEPDRFIPIAEETGLIIPIGRWVLEEACTTVARWHRDHPEHRHLSMAVNISARQLESPELVDHVGRALARSGIDPSTLVVETTETALIRDPGVAAGRLTELSTLGVRLAIDDFGTGYSSLSYLRQFPVDILKIDRSFISTISDRSQVPAIVRGLLDLGRTLQLETIAEGVEFGIQRDHLRDEHCDLAQGFLFSRPLELDDAERLLTQLRARTPADIAGTVDAVHP
jgi:diguanylate cyclase (GGDEF)-like protein/PAS domain S-box-containing protein